MANVVNEFVRHVLPGVIRPLRALWNEIIGFIFLCLALVPLPRLYRQWREFEETGSGLSGLVTLLCFVIVMGIFGVHSFLRARKITRT
jgi:hypothetical protein